MSSVFVDTSAFLALVDRDDDHHGRAKRYLRDLSRKRFSLVTSSYVVDEALTLIRYRLGHPTAVGFGERLLGTRWCRVVDVDEAIRNSAWEIFVRYDDHKLSFTDCTSFALMRALDLGEAFSFDADFAAMGFTRLPR